MRRRCTLGLSFNLISLFISTLTAITGPGKLRLLPLPRPGASSSQPCCRLAAVGHCVHCVPRSVLTHGGCCRLEQHRVYREDA